MWGHHRLNIIQVDLCTLDREMRNRSIRQGNGGTAAVKPASTPSTSNVYIVDGIVGFWGRLSK
ncbi:hypothetical protein A2U01_0090255, partial [Trifolium medium]|nr:hypothetical protein [Trifolium medium]